MKRRLFEEVPVPSALYETETWSMAVAEKKLKVMETRCLKSMCGVKHRDRVRNEVQRRNDVTGVESFWSIRAEYVDVV